MKRAARFHCSAGIGSLVGVLAVNDDDRRFGVVAARRVAVENDFHAGVVARRWFVLPRRRPPMRFVFGCAARNVISYRRLRKSPA
jgi:hypothetical protein